MTGIGHPVRQSNQGFRISERAQIHFPFSICHFSFVIVGDVRIYLVIENSAIPQLRRRPFVSDINDKWKMINGKWKMIRPEEILSQKLTNSKNDLSTLPSGLSGSQPDCPKHQRGFTLQDRYFDRGLHRRRTTESHADFVHKLGIVLKELNETSIWLRIIKQGEIFNSESMAEICEECGELSRIFTSSLKTARKVKR